MPNILCIQSHVVHGYVGNRAATFPLQYKGWNVDALNTVNYSNHPGYGRFTGSKTDSATLQGIYKGLCDMDIEYDALLTGYTPNAECLDESANICIDVCIKNKAKNKETVWVLDPVLGDNGKLYVSEAVIPVYKKILESGYVNLTTPNQFEIELLTAVTITDFTSLKICLEKFHKIFKVQNVVISSVILSERDDIIYAVGSSCTSLSNPRIFYYEIRKIDSTFSGCGDLFCALLTDSFYKEIKRALDAEDIYLDNLSIETLPLVSALGKALTSVEKVLKTSFEDEIRVIKERNGEVPSNLSIKDLRIIESRKIFGSSHNDLLPLILKE